ncbi:MAG TPA: hypothetical protein V6C99_04395 [Oculatellaceae cyanobacterium]
MADRYRLAAEICNDSKGQVRRLEVANAFFIGLQNGVETVLEIPMEFRRRMMGALIDREVFQVIARKMIVPLGEIFSADELRALLAFTRSEEYSRLADSMVKKIPGLIAENMPEMIRQGLMGQEQLIGEQVQEWLVEQQLPLFTQYCDGEREKAERILRKWTQVAQSVQQDPDVQRLIADRGKMTQRALRIAGGV